MRTFFEWLFGYCPCCGRWFQYSTKRRRQSTSYEDDKSNYIICCKECFFDIEDYWDEQWEELRREQIASLHTKLK